MACFSEMSLMLIKNVFRRFNVCLLKLLRIYEKEKNSQTTAFAKRVFRHWQMCFFLCVCVSKISVVNNLALTILHRFTKIFCMFNEWGIYFYLLLIRWVVVFISHYLLKHDMITCFWKTQNYDDDYAFLLTYRSKFDQ